MADVSEEIMKRNKLDSDDVAWLVPHQANKRIIDATARRMGVGTTRWLILKNMEIQQMELFHCVYGNGKIN